MTSIESLSEQLSRSLRKPGRGTLGLIDKALGYLVPFESSRARTVSAYERRELLALIDAHRGVLMPYMDVDRVEANLLYLSLSPQRNP